MDGKSFDDDDVIKESKPQLEQKTTDQSRTEKAKNISSSDNVSSNISDAGTNTSSFQSSLFNTSQSFTMESFTVESYNFQTVTDDSGYVLNNHVQRSGFLCQCCMKAASPSTSSLNPSDIGDSSKCVGQNKNSKLLPPQAEEDQGKITLVLDLDETLVHSSFLAKPNADYKFILSFDKNPVGVFVCVRPFAEKLINELGSIYEIVIFTASCSAYADPVIDFIDKNHLIKHRLYRDSCIDYGGSFIKDLQRLNRKLEKVIIIDNSNVAYLLQPHNAISISSWFEDPADDELKSITEFLKKHHDCDNVYDILVSS